MPGKLQLLVCKNHQLETEAALHGDAYDDVIISAFPANCGRPHTPAENLSYLFEKTSKEITHTIILGGSCISNLQKANALPVHCELRSIGNCSYYFANRTLIDKYMCTPSYLFTSGWLAHWKKNIQSWGFDSNTAPEFFAEFADTLVHFDTAINPNAKQQLAEFSDFAGLPNETVPLGLDYFKLYLQSIILNWRINQQRATEQKKSARIMQKCTDYAMALQLLSDMTEHVKEEDVINNILDTFFALFSPKTLFYAQVKNQQITQIYKHPLTQNGVLPKPDTFEKQTSPYQWTSSKDGFQLNVTYKDETVGYLKIKTFQVASEKERYLNLALNMVSVCGLAIHNARSFQQVKQTEIELRATTEELIRSNLELEQFAFTASHDLQEPLRKIQSFGNLLTTRYAAHLNTKGQTYLQYINKSANRMQELIEGLLNLSRITSRGQTFESVNLQSTAQKVISDLEFRIQKNKARVNIGNLPTIEADPLQMQLLLQNLISNALKFHKKNISPIVNVKANRKGDDICLSVTDNGIGFDEKYASRIFDIFERLHGSKEYDGTGIGLSICKKITARHGGSISAKSRPGQSATFTVTLPISHTMNKYHQHPTSLEISNEC